MIYLIDDSPKAQYNIEFVTSSPYDEILKVVENKSQFDEIETQLSDADCLLVHLSFNKGNIIAEEIKMLADDGDEIPVVIFSASDSESPSYKSGSGIINGIKKSVFYSRLKDFLDEYLRSNAINLDILAFGKNYQKEDIKSSAVQILNLLNAKTSRSIAETISEFEKTGLLEKIILASQPALGITYQSLKDSMLNSRISIDELKVNLQKIVLSFYQYGKNVYPWK